MEIKTNRLIIKNLSINDQKEMIDLLNNNEIKKTYMIPSFVNKEESIEYFNKLLNISLDDKHYLNGIYLNNYLIGMINDIHIDNKEIEIGYFINPIYWNKGYATEALKAMIDYLFNIGFKRIIAGYFEENIASSRVMAKSGMKPIDFTDNILYRNKNHKCRYYEIIKE